MKKYALLGILGLIFMGVRVANAQKQPYNIIVVEEFTGTWCNSCPRATDTIAALLKDYPRLEVIGYQLERPNSEVLFLYNTNTYSRSGYYDTVRSLPTAFINGDSVLKDAIAISKHLRRIIEKKLNDETPYAMTLEAKHFPLYETYRDSFEIKVKIERTAPDTASNRQLRLQLVFTQDHLPVKWYNQTEVNHAATFLYPYPDGNGTAVTLDASGKAELNFAFSVSRRATKWPASKGHLVAFLQDERVLRYETTAIGKTRAVKDNTILQADRADFSTGELTVTEDIKTPDFWATPTELDGSGTVRFYDNTFGETSSWKWGFEGGSPDTSSLSHPVVYYAEPGYYEVRLTTVSEDTSRSYTRGEFVRVLDTKPRIGITPNPARPNQPVKIEVLSLADSCEWLLLGSSTMFGSGKVVETTYPREGSFNVNVKTFYKSPLTGISYTHDSTAVGAMVISKNAPVDNEDFLDNSIRIVKSGDSFEVKTERAVEYVEVYASSGRRVLSTRRTHFSLAGQPSGVYLVSVKPVDGASMIFKILR